MGGIAAQSIAKTHESDYSWICSECDGRRGSLPFVLCPGQVWHHAEQTAGLESTSIASFYVAATGGPAGYPYLEAGISVTGNWQEYLIMRIWRADPIIRIVEGTCPWRFEQRGAYIDVSANDVAAVVYMANESNANIGG